MTVRYKMACGLRPWAQCRAHLMYSWLWITASRLPHIFRPEVASVTVYVKSTPIMTLVTEKHSEIFLWWFSVFAEINALGAQVLEAIKQIPQSIKPRRFCVAPLPPWKTTHQNPSVLCTPPFEKSLFLLGAYFGWAFISANTVNRIKCITSTFLVLKE